MAVPPTSRGVLFRVNWKGRGESLDVCTSRLLTHFATLGSEVEGLTRWHRTTMRKPKRPQEVDVRSRTALSALLEEGVNRRDVDQEPMPELGWSLQLWNGDRDGISAVTRVVCNCTSPRLGNYALLRVDYGTGGELARETAIRLLKGLISAWQPDRGAAVSHGRQIAFFHKAPWQWLAYPMAERFERGRFYVPRELDAPPTPLGS